MYQNKKSFDQIFKKTSIILSPPNHHTRPKEFLEHIWETNTFDDLISQRDRKDWLPYIRQKPLPQKQINKKNLCSLHSSCECERKELGKAFQCCKQHCLCEHPQITFFTLSICLLRTCRYVWCVCVCARLCVCSSVWQLICSTESCHQYTTLYDRSLEYSMRTERLMNTKTQLYWQRTYWVNRPALKNTRQYTLTNRPPRPDTTQHQTQH